MIGLRIVAPLQSIVPIETRIGLQFSLSKLFYLMFIFILAHHLQLGEGRCNLSYNQVKCMLAKARVTVS